MVILRGGLLMLRRGTTKLRAPCALYKNCAPQWFSAPSSKYNSFKSRLPLFRSKHIQDPPVPYPYPSYSCLLEVTIYTLNILVKYKNTFYVHCTCTIQQKNRMFHFIKKN